MARREERAWREDAVIDRWAERYEEECRRVLKLVGFGERRTKSSPDDIGEGEHVKVLLAFAQRHPRTGDFDTDEKARDEIIADWNAWVETEREKNKDFEPDLIRFNCTAVAWKSTSLWGKSLKNSAREALRLDEIDWRRAHLEMAHLDGVALGRSRLDGARCWAAQFRGARLFWANLEGAHLAEANLEGAYLIGANLKGADLSLAHLDAAWLRAVDFTNVNVFGIHYRHYRGIWPFRHSLMFRRYLAIRGVESCYGSPGFRRDALDQDFIDQKFEDCKLTKWMDPAESKWFGWLLDAPPVQLLRRVRWGELHDLIPRRMLFWLWSLSDYGRSTLGVMLYVTATIGAIGALYEGVLVPHHHVVLTGDSAGLPFAAWYAAGMGAATLGLTDLMKPLDVWGQLAMFGNALSGLMLFGMMVAVLQNKVARRS